MSYATTEDVQARSKRTLTARELELCKVLLEDAAVIIDTYNQAAQETAKKTVSCSMVLRSLGDGEAPIMPLGATQGTISAGGYSQSFTMGGGSSGELYITKLEKKLLGAERKAGFISPWRDCND